MDNDAYTDQTGRVEDIREGVKIETAENHLGIFARADSIDIQEWIVEDRLEKNNELFKKFSEEQNIKDYSPSIVFYHNRFAKDNSLLEMGAIHMGRNPVSEEVFFIMEYRRAFKESPPIQIIRLDDYLGGSKSDNLTVWTYDSSNKSFGNPRDERSEHPNSTTYKNFLSVINNRKSETYDPFLSIAKSITAIPK